MTRYDRMRIKAQAWRDSPRHWLTLLLVFIALGILIVWYVG